MANLESNVDNISTGMLPSSVIDKPNETDTFFNKLIKLLKEFVNPLNFFSESKGLHQSNVPSEFKPNPLDAKTLDANQVKNQVDNFLGGSTGFFGSSLPEEIVEIDANSTRKAYEKSTLPEEVISAP